MRYVIALIAFLAAWACTEQSVTDQCAGNARCIEAAR